jgi:hypothetical protein
MDAQAPVLGQELLAGERIRLGQFICRLQMLLIGGYRVSQAICGFELVEVAQPAAPTSLIEARPA